MAKSSILKKQKSSTKPKKQLTKKPSKKKLKKTLTLTTSTAATSPSAASSSDSDTEQDLQTLLQPFTKDQLITIITDAAIGDPSFYNRITDTADQDVSHRKIFVRGIGWDTNRDDLLKIFQPYGDIEYCNVVVDRNTGKTKGYGFVLYKSRRSATKALKKPNKKIGNGVAIAQLASLGVPPNADTAFRKVYVSNVPVDVDAIKLKAFFEKFGEIETGPIGFDSATGKSKGYALFVYKTLEGAYLALKEPIKVFDGVQLQCQKALDGKNKAPSGPTVQPQPPVLAAVAAAQNMALYSQHPSLNPLYSGLAGSPYVGSMGYGGYGGSGLGLNGGLGAGSSVLGSYGSGLTGSGFQGLQPSYPGSQLGQASSSRAYGSGGSYGSYPPYMWFIVTGPDEQKWTIIGPNEPVGALKKAKLKKVRAAFFMLQSIIENLKKAA